MSEVANTPVETDAAAPVATSTEEVKPEEVKPAVPFESLPEFMRDALSEINSLAKEHNADVATYKAQREGARDETILTAASGNETDEDVVSEVAKLNKLVQALTAQRAKVIDLQKTKMNLGMSDADVDKLKAKFQKSGKDYRDATEAFKSQGPMIAGMFKALGLPADLDLTQYLVALKPIGRGTGGGTTKASGESASNMRIHGIGVIQLHEGDKEYDKVGRPVKNPTTGEMVTKYNFTFLAAKIKGLTQKDVDTKDIQLKWLESQGKTPETRDEMRDGSFDYTVTDAKDNERTFTITITKE